MVKRTGTTTLELQNLIKKLREASTQQKVNIWKRIAEDLSRSTRQRRRVNLYTIQNAIRDNETAIIPGKVLSVGDFDKKVTVAAYQFSEEARTKINQTGKAISIQELLQQNPKGSKVRIIG